MAFGRKTGGRQKGTPNKKTTMLVEAMKAAALGLPPDVTALQLQQAVYRNESFPIEVRLRASEAAMPYEQPRLATVQHTGANGGPIATTTINLDALPVDDAR